MSGDPGALSESPPITLDLDIHALSEYMAGVLRILKWID